MITSMKSFKILSINILLTQFVACNTPKSEANTDTDSSESAQMSSASVVGEEVQYAADTVQMMGYIAYDKNISGPRPAVLVVHEWWGHNEHARNAADKLAAMGYLALAVDMFGGGQVAAHPQDAGAFTSELMYNFDLAEGRFNAASDLLKQHPNCDANKVAAIGYCFGGGVVLSMARRGADLDAVASFHGSLPAIERAKPGQIKAKVLVMNGADDKLSPAPVIKDFEEEMRLAGADYEVVNYPGAQHAFTNMKADSLAKEFGLPLAYSAEADKQSWIKLSDFLRRTFAQP